MSSEQISKVANHRFVRGFTFSIIQSIRAKNFSYEEKQVVHADMVPGISERVKQATLRPRVIPRKPIPAPIPVKPIATEAQEGYGKLIPLLNDPSISMIECQGAGRPLKILRMGQTQLTRIVLIPQDIKNILGKVSHEARIPLMDGVFRAAVEGFTINAVISEMIGSRFVIRKGLPEI